MNSGSEGPGPHQRLAIHRSREAFENGLGELVVHCPRGGRLVSVEECETCDFNDGFHLDRTDRDSFLKCTYDAGKEATPPAAPTGARVREVPVSEVMTRRVISVLPELPVIDLLRILVERSISGVPVVDEAGRPIGVVSKSDLLREQHHSVEAFARRTTTGGWEIELEGASLDHLEQATVADIMMPFAFSVRESASVAQAAELMAYEGVHRLPVVGSDGRVVGIISALDILRWIAG